MMPSIVIWSWLICVKILSIQDLQVAVTLVGKSIRYEIPCINKICFNSSEFLNVSILKSPATIKYFTFVIKDFPLYIHEIA